MTGGDEPWRMGVLFSQSGVTAAIERSMLKATLLAIEEINAAGGVLGLPLEPVVVDPQSDPRRYRALAEQLVGEQGLRVIFGCYMSSTRKAVLPVVEQHRALLCYPTLYEGFEFSANCLYSGAAPNQNSTVLLRYLLETHGKRFYLVGSNYVFPYESNRIVTDVVRQSRGTILEERYLPLGAQEADFEPVLAEIVRLQPEVIFSTVVGSGTGALYRAYRRAGLDPASLPIASLTTTEAEAAEMGAELVEGHLTAAPFFETLERPEARAFVAAMKRRFGPEAVAPSSAEAAYFQTHLLAQALAAAGTDRLEPLREQLLGREIEAPQGRVRVDPDNHHCYLWPRVARADARGRFEVVLDCGQAVKPDPYFIAPTLSRWGEAPRRVRPE